MATLVLVPGFWLGAWAWQRVTAPLRAAGHEVYPLSLTGLADRVHLNGPGVTLDTHIDDIINLITYEDLHDVVLVGHSAGGLAVTGAADRIPGRVASIVYVDSGTLPDGVSFLSAQPPDERHKIEQTVKERGDGRQIPVPAFDPAEDPDNLAGLSDADLRLMRDRCTPQPYGSATARVRLTSQARRDLPTPLVACTFTLDQVRAMLADRHPYVAELAEIGELLLHELPTGHWPMFSRPGDLAALLNEIVRT